MEFRSVIILKEDEYSNPKMDESTTKSPWKAFPENDLETCSLLFQLMFRVLRLFFFTHLHALLFSPVTRQEFPRFEEYVFQK